MRKMKYLVIHLHCDAYLKIRFRVWANIFESLLYIWLNSWNMFRGIHCIVTSYAIKLYFKIRFMDSSFILKLKINSWHTSYRCNSIFMYQQTQITIKQYIFFNDFNSYFFSLWNVYFFVKYTRCLKTFETRFDSILIVVVKNAI